MNKFLRVYILSLLLLSMLKVVMAQSENDCPETQFTEAGMSAVVTPGDANKVRAEPSLQAEEVGRIPPGEPFNIAYRPAVCADGYLWRKIETFTLSGWTVEIPVGSEEPFIVPFVPEARTVGQKSEDGSILVEESGIRFNIPAGLKVAKVTLTPEVGIFSLDRMSAQPSSVVFTLLNEQEDVLGEIEIFPYHVSDLSYEYLGNSRLETLLSEQPSLLEYAASERMPQSPISGTAAVFGGAGAYVPLGSGNGLRYITYFAQNSVIFTADMVFEYLYRGITTDQAFLVTAQDFPVHLPLAAIPAEVDPYSDGVYVRYLRELEANLSTQPTSAFTPDLALLDAIFTSLAITDNDATLKLIP